MAYTTIKKSSDYFNTKLWTGDGSLPRAITGVGHQPDFVWIKNRDVGYQHQLYDSVRGTSAGVLYSSLSDAEDSTYQMSSFDSDGYTMGPNLGAVNGSGENIVAWNWKANGAGSANTDGSISSTVSANTTSGFSIVSYTGNGTGGATIGHGLGVSPSWIVTKKRSATGSWVVYHKSQGATKYGIMDSNAAFGTSSTLWNNTEPTSSVFSVGTDADTNGSGSTFIAYCFAEKQGFSKFGSYTGNGSTDGTFVYTGFKPQLVIIKQTSNATNWAMNDIKRQQYNAQDVILYADTSGAESNYSGNYFDILSNGFKMRLTSSYYNGSGNNYIYMAFAEEPLVGDNPATAR